MLLLKYSNASLALKIPSARVNILPETDSVSGKIIPIFEALNTFDSIERSLEYNLPCPGMILQKFSACCPRKRGLQPEIPLNSLRKLFDLPVAASNLVLIEAHFATGLCLLWAEEFRQFCSRPTGS